MNRIKTAAFTIVELIVTLVIMLILVALSVAVVGNIQASARDSERQQDIEALARGLELRYKRGITYEFSNYDGTKSGNFRTTSPGTYPSDNEMWEWGWFRSIPDEKIFTGATTRESSENNDSDGLLSPSGLRLGYICALAGFNSNCDKAEKPMNVEAAFSNGNGGWNDIYMFESIGPNGNYCNNDPNNINDTCVRFNLYWISETDKTINPKFPNIPGLKIIQSRHRQ